MHATCSHANPPREPTKKTGEDPGLLANFGSAGRTSLSSLRGSHQALKPVSLIVRRSSHDPLSAAITRSITSCIANTPDLNSSHTILLNQIGRTNTNFPGSDEFNSGTCATLILGSAPLLRQFYLFQRLFGMPNNFFRSLWPPHIRHGDYTFQLGQASASSDDNGFQNETQIDLWRQLLMESTLYMHRPPDSLQNAGATYQRPLHFSIEMRDRYGAMWLDVDSMSYEELLALEDHIGYVSTGLSEEAAVTSLKRSNYFVFKEENVQKDFCSIGQEDFVEEDELGTLDCGHGFHISCIKQWLGHKNVCPMCKSPGLSSKLPSFSHIQSQ
ncbi:hypothetical protein ACFX2I_025956 [Malus domestica]|uniref:uncharacterized protein n=1 Tax=Malus domestica TaxID=3750 RepID=UPI0010AA79AD|nr:uncharacterized protein LOC103406707 [Malus domestica]XP_028964609.1 uncharacterized protein LOC103406707 [Malus domestica]XP_028964613.1 uncharacterized protein LOC103406707 [Malus domestica]XP_028964615.1 uncharacterized protein LOC103406707 [Malus domestica]